MSAQAQEPPITIIEPENLETIFITGGLVEAIDKQTVRIVAWIDQPSTHSRKRRGGTKRRSSGTGMAASNRRFK